MVSKSIFKWPKSRPTKPRSITRTIAVHCSATPEGKHFTAADIDSMHLHRGWVGIGYHYVILLDGTIEEGRPRDAVGSHAAGHNSTSVSVCYIGGVGTDGKPKDTRTADQKEALRSLLTHLKAVYRASKPTIQGHRDFPKVAKACPSFDAKSEYANL